MRTLDQMLDEMWNDYCQLNPKAKNIHQKLTAKGETVLNDHIALRTFRSKNLGVDQLARPFEKLGYTAKDDYHFEQKKLYAKHYEHQDPTQPKIFISELKLEECSQPLQEIIHGLIDDLPQDQLARQDLSYAGRLWNLESATYEKLAEESEYASWLAAFGFRPNHFTVNVNELKHFKGLEELNAFLEEQGHTLNSSGGKIKGSPEQHLEQSSTMAESTQVQFSDKSLEVPACYYEFAKRYPLPDGTLYQGFVATSADKIFESTDRKI